MKPEYADEGKARFALRACLRQPVVLQPGEKVSVPLGFIIAISQGFEGQIHPFNGLSLKDGLVLADNPGTIESDYRGEVSVTLKNTGSVTHIIHSGDHIAQMIIAPVAVAEQQTPVSSGETVLKTLFSSGGFGSTGIAAVA
jgi:dUTP pyrophosphatase